MKETSQERKENYETNLNMIKVSEQKENKKRKLEIKT